MKTSARHRRQDVPHARRRGRQHRDDLDVDDPHHASSSRAADLERAARSAAHRVRARLRPGLRGAAARAEVAGRPVVATRRANVSIGVTSGTLCRCAADSQLIPWSDGGRVSASRCATADDVVRETGWVFNNETGDAARRSPSSSRPATTRCSPTSTCSGCARRRPTTRHAGRDRLRHRPHDVRASRREFGTVYRLRPRRRRSSSAAARRSPGSARSTGCARSRSPTAARSTSPTTCADLAFSYITLQHCERDDALDARRPRPCGSSGPAATSCSTSARGRVRRRAVCRPAALVRASCRIPTLGAG